MTTRPGMIDVHVHPDAASVIGDAAAAAHPLETGGILLGWYVDDLVVVRYAIEVPDPDATGAGWTREQERAQAAMDAALAEVRNPWAGYIGDWHSHPAPIGPSDLDIAVMRDTSREYANPIALLVHRADGVLDPVVTHRGRVLQATVRALSA